MGMQPSMLSHNAAGGSSSSTSRAGGANDLIVQPFDADSPTLPIVSKTNGAAAQRPKSNYANVFDFGSASAAPG